MKRPQSLDANSAVLKYIGETLDPDTVSMERPGAAVDTWKLGAHPDLVDRLWDELALHLGPDSPFLVGGNAALVDPRSGLICAVARGTWYAIRLSGDALRDALGAGYEVRHTYTYKGAYAGTSDTLDLSVTIGPGWVFGEFDKREGDWLAQSCREVG